jgi:hypothetical protein
MTSMVRLLAAMASAMLLASGVVVLTIIGSPRTVAAAERPNIVFVLTDDQFPGTENAMPALQSNLVRQASSSPT